MPTPPFQLWIDARKNLKHVAAARKSAGLCGVSVTGLDNADTWNYVTHIPTCEDCLGRVPDHVRRHYEYVRGIPL